MTVFAQPALVAFAYLLEKKAKPDLEPLPHSYGIEKVWGVEVVDEEGKAKNAARDIVKALLPEAPSLEEGPLSELTDLAKKTRRHLHANAYQPHWCEHVQGADNLRFLQKSLSSHVPFILLDLEDAVAFSKKVETRDLLKGFLTKGEFHVKKDKVEPGAAKKKLHPGNKWIALRPNNLGTKFSAGDFSLA